MVSQCCFKITIFLFYIRFEVATIVCCFLDCRNIFCASLSVLNFFAYLNTLLSRTLLASIGSMCIFIVLYSIMLLQGI